VFSFGRDSALRLASIKCDKRGNILTRKHYDYSTSDPLLLLDTVTYSYNGTWKDKLVSYNGASITYDSLGNPLTYGSGTFTWDKGRQLSVVNTGTKSISYKYNAEGLRTRKTEGNVTTEYTWVSGLLMSMTDGTNTLQFSYSPEGEALSVKYNGTDYYYIRNLQGDVTGIYNYVGSVVVKYAYDAWGKIISVTGSMANTLGKLNPFRYRSYIYDEETGFYYLQSRYYDPEIGRFINADIFVSTGTGLNGFNMFAYCGNNPVMYVDVTGTMHVKGMYGDGTPGTYKKFSVGFDVYHSAIENTWSIEHLFLGFEQGYSFTVSSKTRQYDDFVFYLEIPHENYSIFDYRVGVNCFIGDGGFSFDANLSAVSFAVAFNDTCIEYNSSLSKMGVAISQGVDYRNLSAEYFGQVYVRPVPTVAVLACCFLVPKAIPFVVSYITDFIAQFPSGSPAFA